MNRFSRSLNSVAARVESLLAALRGPEESRVPIIPGAMTGGYGEAQRPDQRTMDEIRSWGAMSGRLGPSMGPMLDRFSSWPADNLTPEIIGRAQRSAVTSGIPLEWVELIDQIYSRDGHYASCTMQRVSDVIKGTWRVAPVSDDPAGLAMANFVAEAYQGCSRWRDGLGWLLMANLYGYSAVEIEWGEEEITFPGPKGEIIGPVTVAIPKRLHPLHPKHFRFELKSDDPLLWIGNTYQPLPYGKVVFLDGEGLHPIKARRGHAWQCVWYSLFRSLAWSAWATHVDRFSLPVPLITYNGDVAQYQEYQDAFSSIMNSLGQGKGAILPKTGAEFQILDPAQGGRSNDPASALGDACDAGQSIRVLGGQLNNKIGNVGSFAASTNHLDIKYGIEELDGFRAWERIDEQATEPLIRFNAEVLARALTEAGYPVTPQMLCRRVPRGKHHVPGKTDPEAEMRVIDYAVNKLGLSVSAQSVFARMDLQRATDDADRIPGEAQSVGKGGALIPTADAAQAGGVVNPDTAAEKTAEAAAKTAAQPAAGQAGEKPAPSAPQKAQE